MKIIWNGKILEKIGGISNCRDEIPHSVYNDEDVCRDGACPVSNDEYRVSDGARPVSTNVNVFGFLVFQKRSYE